MLRSQILLSLLIVFCPASVMADSIVIYGGDVFPPQIILKNGKPAGFVPVLFERLSRDTGDSYQFILFPWKRAVSESTAGNGGIVDFSYKQERAKLFDYSEPLFVNRLHILVLKDRVFKFNALADLSGKHIGLLLGSSYGDRIDQAIADKLFYTDFDTNEKLRYRKLLNGRFDAAIADIDSFNLIVQSDPELLANRDRFVFLPNPIIEDPLYLAFPKTMHMLPALKRFNQALNALKKTKEYQKIITDYSSADH